MRQMNETRAVSFAKRRLLRPLVTFQHKTYITIFPNAPCLLLMPAILIKKQEGKKIPKQDLNIRGAFGKFLARSFILVTDLQNLSCLVSF